MDKNFDIGAIVEQLKADPALLAKFRTQPIAALESILKVDLPDEKIKPLIAGIKLKLEGSDIADKLGGLFGR